MVEYKILIVDDDESHRRFAKIALSKFILDKDLNFDEADGYEGLIAKTEENEYAAVLTDNDMPNFDEGIKAIREIRKRDTSTPIILVSGRYEFVKSKAKEAGVTDGILKPYEFKELADLVNQYL